MFKFIPLTFFILILNESGSASVVPNHEVEEQFASHLQDFLDLIDLEKVMGVAMKYLSDPEVLQFVGYVFSPEMEKMFLELQQIDEFREAMAFLASKGYNVHYYINLINSALDLPPFETPKALVKLGKGVNGLIEELIASLPLDDMKKMFENKLETSPEVAQLFDTINSEEFLGILRRMSKNPKFLEFKGIFEGYGFDFKYICQLAIGILGDYYQGVFCM